ncbi:MAG: PadR family transcriptional regulator [Clostridiales bacterium]|nr:PadR family transcriptional regulator [Clostridiales bacterium]
MNLKKVLPLTETTFYILVALLEPGHGYAVMQKVEEISGGTVRIAAGTMYGAIEHLLKQGWIAAAASDDARRKVYVITPLGRQVLGLEAQRLRYMAGVAGQYQL